MKRMNADRETFSIEPCKCDSRVELFGENGGVAGYACLQCRTLYSEYYPSFEKKPSMNSLLPTPLGTCEYCRPVIEKFYKDYPNGILSYTCLHCRNSPTRM